MTLKSMLDRKNHGSIQYDTKSGVIPVGILIVNGNKTRGWWWRVGVGILCIATKYKETELSRKSHEQPLDMLINTGGVGHSNGMEGGEVARGAIAAIARAASTITFNMVLPMGAEDRGARRAAYRVTVHAKLVEVV